MRAHVLLGMLFAVVAGVAGSLVTGCVAAGSYVWVDDVPLSELKPQPYHVQLGDKLVVNVWNQPGMSGEVLVRPDGNITIPLVGDVYVYALTPNQAGNEVAKKLTGLVVDPHVAVSLAATREPTVSVLGEVKTSGAYGLHPGEGVLDIVARAGGLTEFAADDRIFVIRKGEAHRIRFSWDKLQRAEGNAAQFELLDGDVVVIE